MKKIYSLLSILSICLFSQAQINLVINEIMYSPPAVGVGGGVEYMEIYNNGSASVNLRDYTIDGSFSYTFPATTLNVGDYVLLSNDSAAFAALYGLTAYDYNGFILNAGSVVRLKDNFGLHVDSVKYENSAPWPSFVNAQGASLQLCDPNSDNNDPINWTRSINDLGKESNNRKLYGTPGSANTCPQVPVIQLQLVKLSVNEDAGNVDLTLYIDNPVLSATTVEVHATSGTADVNSDITFTSPTTVTFPANFQGSQTVSLSIVNDTVDEPDETFDVTIKNATNNALILHDNTEVTINTDPNDRAVDREMRLIGIADDHSGGAARLIEVELLVDLADISKYGLGCANNGGGTDGVEFTFPAVPGKKGDHYFVTNDSASFHTFYGIAPTYVSPGFNGVASYNGDDAIELFENGRVIDRYGLPDVDGTGEVWEYTDGWAHRRNNSGPDKDQFIPLNWEFSMNALAGAATNGEATKPYPLPKEVDPGDTTNPTLGLIGMTEEPFQITLYPNPAHDMITISANGFELKSGRIYNSIGKLVAEYDLEIGNLQIPIAELEKGFYIAEINTQNGNVEILRFMKE